MAPMTFTRMALTARMAAPPKKVLFFSAFDKGYIPFTGTAAGRLRLLAAAQPKSRGRAYSFTSRLTRSMSMVRNSPSLYMTLPRHIFMDTSQPWAA